ncbi:MAG: restriction endonuclease [Candidatus Marinimicrobia bacterium]|nr:restriction endonuclease [Candidatus Neomarinimicrobiota bacterium]|tara:strand:+ start:55 stop:1230 length:1176 start_codon:yes stop_codon:yes gene_type:complete
MAIKFKDLNTSDLIIDEVYEGGTANNAGDDPISKILKTGISGGFRKRGNTQNGLKINYCALYTTLSDPDWPDSIDLINGSFTYFGDNKKPGDILNTRHKGNLILEESFKYEHLNERENIPPFFIFSKAGNGRNVIFRGLAVPGYPGMSNVDNLVAVWSLKDKKRFQNYKATFSILKVNRVSRKWIDNLLIDRTSIEDAPKEWLKWLNNKKYEILTATPVRHYRNKDEQLPSNSADFKLLDIIFKHFSPKPTHFEIFSSEILKYMDKNIGNMIITQATVDGGRDGIGKYSIGNNKEHSLKFEFAMESKCFNPQNTSCGVNDIKRLISRLRHRQFGILVTTTYLGRQAYKEIINDQHPVLIIAAIDLVSIVKSKYAKTPKELKNKLKNEFPIS